MTVLKEYKGSGDPADPANWETIFVAGVGETGPIGPTGARGIQGPQGNIGPAGPPPPTASLTRAQWQALSPPDLNTLYIITDEGGVMMSGITAPAANLGYNGDFYLDSAALLLYGPKKATGWGTGTSVRGPKGDTGSTGAAGPEGPVGGTSTLVQKTGDTMTGALAVNAIGAQLTLRDPATVVPTTLTVAPSGGLAINGAMSVADTVTVGGSIAVSNIFLGYHGGYGSYMITGGGTTINLGRDGWLSLVGPANGGVYIHAGGAAQVQVKQTEVVTTAPVSLPADPARPLDAATKQYVDGKATAVPDVLVVANQWHQPPDALGTPVGANWPINNRLYLTWFFTPKPMKVDAVAVNVTTAGGAGVVIRMAIYDTDPATGLPTTVRYQGTVAGDTIGVKTLTVPSPPTVEGRWLVLTGPQGSGSPGGTWMHGGNSTFRRRSTYETVPLNSNAHSGVDSYIDLSGPVSNNPPMTWDYGNGRTPLISVRYAS